MADRSVSARWALATSPPLKDPVPLRLATGFRAKGKVHGHGAGSWFPLDHRPDGVLARRSPVDAGPVVAVLDTALVEHVFLTPGHRADPVSESPPEGAPALWWVPREEDYDIPQRVWSEPTPPPPDNEDRAFGPYHAHATFLAGLVRYMAPDVRVLSLPVMDDEGVADEKDLVAALDYLGRHAGELPDLRVVLMAFGRVVTDPDSEIDALRQAIAAMRRAYADQGVDVTVVAASGNNQEGEPQGQPSYPGFFAATVGSGVVAVGAWEEPGKPARFSNEGAWVTEHELGLDVVSCIPVAPLEAEDGDTFLAGYASWSGTSFSAAVHAGRLAQRAVGGGAEHPYVEHPPVVAI